MPPRNPAQPRTRFADAAKVERDLAEFAVQPAVRSMGYAIYDPVWRRRHTPAHCELTHVVSGAVDVVVGRTRCTMRPGDTLLLPAGVPHRDCFDLAQGLRTFMAAFDWLPHGAFFARVPPRAMLSLPAARKADVARIVRRMRDDAGDGGAWSQMLAGARVHEILLLCLREAGQQGRKRADEVSPGRARRRALMQSAKQYLEEHYAEPVSLDAIARALYVSPFYLSHVFSRESDFTLFDFLTRLRMDKARNLLEGSGMKIAAVARSVGFENANYFSKVFRKHFGCLPSEFRQSSNKLP